MSHSILRRYTPPTCTLEIMAKNSPLARWAGQPVVNQLRFQLTLDDPTLPKEQWITLRGDRAQLEALHETVSTYVQTFLVQSHSYLNAAGGASSGTSIATHPVGSMDTALSTVSSAPNGLSLRPRGLLTHELGLGALATPENPSVVPLTALQLFDLANALDDYASDLLVLPELSRSRPSTVAVPRWGQLAATGLLVIGLSASVAKLVDYTRQPASPTAGQAGSNNQPLAIQPLPAATSPQPSIASGQKLPPPPPLGSTVPGTPGVPTFPLASLPASPSQASSEKTGSAKTGNIPVGADPSKPTVRLPGAPRQETGNQIAMMPQNGSASSAARARPVPPMPRPLALEREFAKAPSTQSASTEGRAATADRSSASEPIGTAFDTIPQVAEARQYFQQRWTPPQGLTQTLEYTLFVNANGAIQRTMPLGQAAGDYLDRTGIPPAGAAFLSALSNRRNAKIRLVLSPDGTVKTFLEGYY